MKKVIILLMFFAFTNSDSSAMNIHKVSTETIQVKHHRHHRHHHHRRPPHPPLPPRPPRPHLPPPPPHP